MDIFISYAREDLSRVEPIAQALSSLGYSVWWDAHLRAGKRFHRDIERELAAARCVVVLWTQTAVLSDWVYAEAEEALEANKLVPVFLEQVKPPLHFRQVHGVDLSAWDGRTEYGEFQRFVRDIAELAGPGGGVRGPDPGGFGVATVRHAHATSGKVRTLEMVSAKAGPEILSVFQDRLKDGSEGPAMVWLPPGGFLMGSPDGDGMADGRERPQHEVRIARPLAIGRFPVTLKDYDRFCAVAGRDKLDDHDWPWGRARRPVTRVSWEDASSYCSWLSEQTGRTYRLPSEAEWEFACRAGTGTCWSFGGDERGLAEHAWFDRNSTVFYFYKAMGCRPIGKKVANPWGLYDMHGNVWEWVQDHWHGNYQGAPDNGNAWEETRGDRRVVRGGCWFNAARALRSASRAPLDPGTRGFEIGFRLALSSELADQPG